MPCLADLMQKNPSSDNKNCNFYLYGIENEFLGLFSETIFAPHTIRALVQGVCSKTLHPITQM